MNREVTIKGTTYKVYTQRNEQIDAETLSFEKGEKGTPEYMKETRPIKSYQTVEEVYSNMYKQYVDKHEESEWKEKIDAIPVNERHLHPDFGYFRYKNYGVAMYFLSKWSPSGVANMGGLSYEEFEKLGVSAKQRNDF